MIGLKRGTVALVPHNKRWSEEFEKEKKNLERILAEKVIAIEHCGSTAIPGIKAKPIIDILIGVRTVKREGAFCNKKLDSLSKYYSRNAAFPKKDRFVVAKGDEDSRTHYLHIVRYQGAIWNRMIKLRDALRKNKNFAKQYSKLKEELAKAHPDERRLYTEKKSDFIKKILKEK